MRSAPRSHGRWLHEPPARKHVRSPTCTSSRRRCGSIGAVRTPRTPGSSRPGSRSDPSSQWRRGAIESGDPGGLVRLLSDVVFDEVKRRLDRVLALRPAPGASVPEVREYVEAMLGLQVWSNMVFKTLQGDPHAQSGVHED